MDDSTLGTRDKRGDWKPNYKLEIAPFWNWPPNLMKVLKWIPSFLFPWNAFHLAVTLIYWFFLLPDQETMKTITWDWALWLFACNTLGVALLFGGIEYFWLHKRRQGTKFKYNGKFPGDSKSEVFWFSDQNIDNALRTFLLSVPLWTLVQVFFLWVYANEFVPWVSWNDSPIYLVCIMLLTPAIHEVHFYIMHRALHWGPLYKWIHSIHHNSINATPFSSLSMHPIESFLFFSQALWHLVIPSNPFCALFQLNFTAYGSINGHIGYEKLEITDTVNIPSEAYAHYLHHKYFDVNYGGDGFVPLDKWLGTWHDGTPEGHKLMQARFKKKAAAQNT